MQVCWHKVISVIKFNFNAYAVTTTEIKKKKQYAKICILQYRF